MKLVSVPLIQARLFEKRVAWYKQPVSLTHQNSLSMRLRSFFFLLASLILFPACVDTIEIVPKEIDNEIYKPYRGTIEMVGENAFMLGGSNSVEFDSDIEILMLIEKRIIFKSEEFVFDLDESQIYGADPCGAHDAHCAEGSSKKRLVFEPALGFWECFYEANCDPRDEVIWFELFLRRPT